MKKKKIWIGTSGWSYKHWRGTFYPDTLKVKDQFNYYCDRFKTVELNNPFYRLPEKSTFEKWKNAVPEDFLYAVKASRYITHMKKLSDPQESTIKFFSNIPSLGKSLGPVLFQLPPGWTLDEEKFRIFLESLPEDFRYTFEFRNKTWYENKVYSMLEKHNCAFCIYELNHHLSPEVVTADFVYIRLHGPGGKYQGSYDEKTLQKWADKCLKWQEDNKEVFIYFDNDQSGYAAFNAQSLQRLVKDLQP